MQRLFGIFSRLPVINGSHVSLRPLTMKDANDIFEYSRDPRVAEYVLWTAHKSIAESRIFLRYVLRMYRQNEPSCFGIIENLSNRVIGTISILWLSEEHASAEVGYSLGYDYWHKGLATEALQLMLGFCFDSLQLNRVEAQHQVDNPASGRVMQKCGMRYEGRLRQRVFNKKHFVDVDLYAILREEYDALKGRPTRVVAPLGGLYRF